MKEYNLFFLKRNKKIISVFVSLLILIIFFLILSSGISKSKLKKELKRGWETYNVNQMRYYEMKLDFKDDTIEYKYISKDSDISETIDTFEYKVISSDEIEIKGKGKYKIEFNDVKNIMTVTPGIIENTELELWYNNDGEGKK